MAIELHIDDGSPHWYLSSNIWVVPGDDPNAPPGVPLVNFSSYVWARVRNAGSTAVDNALVRFYWANPSTIINDNTSHPIGASSVSLDAGETKDVLCVMPWLPQWENNGHECLIAEAFASSNPANPFSGPDPLPVRAPSDAYHVVAWRQMAQKNLDVVSVKTKMLMVHPLTIGNPDKESGAVRVIVRRERIEAIKDAVGTLGLSYFPREADGFDAFGLHAYRCGDQVHDTGKTETEIKLPGGHLQGIALVAQVPGEMRPETGALFLVEQIGRDRQVVGGVGVLVLAPAHG